MFKKSKSISRRWRKPFERVVWLALAATLAAFCDATVQADDEVLRLEDFYEAWQRAAAPWMSPEERQFFASLSSDRQRELFIRHFWQARGEEQLPGGSLEEWWRRFNEAQRRFEKSPSDRARAMIAAGVPSSEQVFGGCRGVLRPLRIWHYDRYQAEALGLADEADGFDLVFLRDYEAEDGLFRSWSRSEGHGALSENDAPWRRDVAQILAFSRERRCFRGGADEERVVGRALRRAVDLATIEEAARKRQPDPTWLHDFRRQLDAQVLKLPAERIETPVAIGYPGRDASKVLVLGRIQVPVEALRRGAADQLFDRLRLLGEARVTSFSADRFEYVYHLSGPPPSDDILELDFYRRLRPGTYELRLRLEDAYGRALLRRDLVLEVPVLESAARIQDDQRPSGGAPLRDLTRRRVLSMVHFPGLAVVPPDANAVGPTDISLLATGSGTDVVELRLNGEKVDDDASPPYRMNIDLGPQPQSHELEAIAFDAAGRVVARASHRLQPSERPLAVKLERRGAEIEAMVSLPAGETLESLELELDGQPLQISSTAPYLAMLPAALPPGSRFVRAVLRTASGQQSEGLLLLDESVPLEAVDVRWVEVYAAVLDPAGRPVVGLGRDDFAVFEDGAAQPIIRFERVEDLPLQVVLAMDTSESMRERLEIAAESARRFFETVVTPKDRAALATFHHDLRLAVPFTADIDRLALGTSGLAAWGGTRLHDAIIFSAGYVGGHEGRRALVLLTDGRDVESDFGADDAKDIALRAGLAVYPIVLGGADERTRGALETLAQESGGRAFAIRSISQLTGVYRQIEQELRSQYLIVYEAPKDDAAEGTAPGSFRRIELKLSRGDLRPRAMHGYYR